MEVLAGISHSENGYYVKTVLFYQQCPSSHTSIPLTLSSFLALLVDTPRPEADEIGIFLSQGQRDDLAQSFSDAGVGLFRPFSTDASNHTHSP